MVSMSWVKFIDQLVVFRRKQLQNIMQGLEYHLLHMQEEFCSAYEQIKEAFIRQGICQVQGTERKLPPDNQFSQIINVDEYNSTYGGENGTLASIGRNSRASVYKPKYMTQDI